jgi:hypothetical protein
VPVRHQADPGHGQRGRRGGPTRATPPREGGGLRGPLPVLRRDRTRHPARPPRRRSLADRATPTPTQNAKAPRTAKTRRTCSGCGFAAPGVFALLLPQEPCFLAEILLPLSS